MPGENEVQRPDPTILTTEQLLRAVQSERDYVDGRISVLEQRLNAMDTATKLLNETVNRTPTQIQSEISHVREIMGTELASVQTQFRERDTRQERESKDNKVAVDAAFAAQKEAAAKQDDSNQKAIDKSERATNEALKTQGELFRSTTDGLKEQVNRLELTVGGIQSTKQGTSEAVKALYAFAAFVLVLLLIGGAVAAFSAARGSG
jgi:cation transport regulator ChaB